MDFKCRYILESIDWYLDFSPEIVKAVRELLNTMEVPIQNPCSKNEMKEKLYEFTRKTQL